MILVSLCAVAAMASVSCQKSEINSVATGSRVKAVINAVSGHTTKLTIDGLQTSWAVGDSICVFDYLGKFEGIYLAESAGTSAKFTGTKGEGDILKYAVSPANSNATCVEGVIRTTIPSEQDGTITNAISVAIEDDGIFAFENAASVLKITIPMEMDDINFICFTSDSLIAGDVDIIDNVAVPSASEDAVKYKRVSIYKDGAPLSGSYYLTVIPGNYPGVVTLGRKDGTVRSAVAIKVAAKDYSINKIHNFGEVKSTTTWVANALPGVYSLDAEGTKALFAQGDIRYNVENKTWRIADTFVNLTTNPKGAYEGEIDLFMWNDATEPGLYKTNFGNINASWTNEGDWTKKLPVTGWSVLSINKIRYLFATRVGCEKQVFGFAYIGTPDVNRKYIIFYPDGWAGPVLNGTACDTAVTAEDLQKLEDQGCAVCGMCHTMKKDFSWQEANEQRIFWSNELKSKGSGLLYRFLFSKGALVAEPKNLETTYGYAFRPMYEIK